VKKERKHMSDLATWFFVQQVFAKATPLLLAALGGLYCERTGVVNIALEGIMLIGALCAVLGAYSTGYPWIGVGAAALSGALIGVVMAAACVRLRGDQIVVGVSLNILALGVTGLLLFQIFGRHGASPSVNKLFPWPAGTWFALPALTWLGLFLVLFTMVLLYRTPLGLRMRAAGENPAVVDSLGVDVFRLRYLGVVAGCILAGLGGAHLSLGDLSQFVERMTAGRGFIALAALIFGKWTPHGALGACLLFGMADAMAEYLQVRAINVPSQIFLMVPFAITMVVLAGWMGRAVPPAADGKPYEKE
jgi:ABC-type uncharacterized transport system permease subunit